MGRLGYLANGVSSSATVNLVRGSSEYPIEAGFTDTSDPSLRG